MKIVLLGDSITQGLGSKKINFVEELQKHQPNDKIVNLAMTGTTICYAQEQLDVIVREHPNVVVILYGNVDAQIRANTSGKLFKCVPKRFKGFRGNMLLPRPFYSHNKMKSLAQHIENGIRTILRKLIYCIDGTEQWVPIAEFEARYRFVCEKLRQNNIQILCCSTVYIDDKLFPGSLAQYKEYNERIKQIAQENGSGYLELNNRLENAVKKNGWKNIYNYDHFHPNGNGYQIMAEWLSQAIQATTRQTEGVSLDD